MAAVHQSLISPEQPPVSTEGPSRTRSPVGRSPRMIDPMAPAHAAATRTSKGDSSRIVAQNGNGDTRTPVIIHNPGQDHIVSAFAKVLGRDVVHISDLAEVTDDNVKSVIGIPSHQHVKTNMTSRNRSRILIVNAHCVDVGMPPDTVLTENCDYEFLYHNKSPYLRRDLARFLCFLSGQSDHHERLMNKPRTYFLSMTFPDIRSALPNIDILTVGCDAVELRVDLLQEPLQTGGFADIPSLSYVGEQLSLLRQRTELPIIFTTRSTDFSNGRFPTDDFEIYRRYLSRAIQWGVEYVDVEFGLPEDLRQSLFRGRGHTRIMSAFHDFSGHFRWHSDVAADIFRRSGLYADIIKMVAIANDQSANFELECFRSAMQSKHPTAPPLSAVNMGEAGHLSRALNRVFTPVTHPLLPIIAAPGQMSIAQVNSNLTSLGHLPTKTIYGVGKLQRRYSMSRSSFFKKCFNELGLPYRFEVLQHQQGRSSQHLDFLRCDEVFGGACLDTNWTLPALLEACPELAQTDDGGGPGLSAAAKTLGIVDTIVVHEAPRSDFAPSPASKPPTPTQREVNAWARIRNAAPSMRLTLDNVSWRGILKVLTMDLAPSAYAGRSAILLSAAADEAASALLAMKALGIAKVYSVGFQTPSTLVMASPTVEHISSIESLQRARAITGGSHPMLIVSALSTVRSNIVAMVVRAFADGQSADASAKQRVFLDLTDHDESNGCGLGLVAEDSGFITYRAAQVAAFATVESLRLLVGQNVPYSFVRLAS
ncbi:type I 3-dehydroquinase domain-containing protein [Sarocladium implicatum]|nr:type I 3-dehydroquinase domain-containing protein [Sarocladium implicatum]